MNPQIIMASGSTFEVPMFDPVVANHFNNAASYTEPLLQQINEEKIYASLFEGKKDLTFLDIGANIGLVSIYAADNCKRIVAVEPAPETFTVLRSMILKFPQIEAVNAALNYEDGPTQFYVNDQNTTASSTVNTFGALYNVPGLTLSSILSIYQLESVDVCKIDCEGAEGEALTYEQLETAAPVIQQYMIECHNCPVSSYSDKMGTLVSHLSRLGYAVHAEGMTVRAQR